MIIAIGVVLAAANDVDVMTLVVLTRVDRTGVVVKAVSRILAAAGDVVVDTGSGITLMINRENTLIVGARIRVTTVGVCRAAPFDGGVGALFVDARVHGAGFVVVAIGVLVAAPRDGLGFASVRIGVARIDGAIIVVDALTVVIATTKNGIDVASITLAVDASARVIVIGTITVGLATVFDVRELTEVSNTLSLSTSIGSMTIGVAHATVGNIVVHTSVLIASIVGARIVVRALEVGNTAVGNHLVLTMTVHASITGARIVIRALLITRAFVAA